MRHRPQHAAPAAHPVRRALARIAAAVGFVLVVFALIGALTLYARHCLRQRGLGAVDAPVLAATPAWGDEFARTGRFEAHIAFTDFAVPDDGETTMAVTWDDAWFDADRTVYNPELAAAGAVIATLAYAESGYYQAGNTCLPYMELGLSALGFTDVSTASYRYRSEVIDEALSLVTQEADGAAYGIAEKRLVGADGTLRDLMVVSVRGSYGSEWLSNLAVDSDDDHPGYREAAAEVARALAPRVKRAHQEGRSVRAAAGRAQPGRRHRQSGGSRRARRAGRPRGHASAHRTRRRRRRPRVHVRLTGDDGLLRRRGRAVCEHLQHRQPRGHHDAPAV